MDGTIARVLRHYLPYGWVFDADLAVLATTFDQDLPDYGGHDVVFVPSPATSPAALAPRMTCLQVPTPDALTRPSDRKGRLQRGISRTLKARGVLNRLAFRHLSPPDYMRVVS